MRKNSSRPMLSAAATLAFMSLIAGIAPHLARAQANPTMSNIIPESEAVTLRAKVTAINPQTRAVSLQGRSGETVTLTAGPAVRLDMLKVDDTVDAKYYRSVAWEVAGPPGGIGTPGPSGDEIAAAAASPSRHLGALALVS